MTGVDTGSMKVPLEPTSNGDTRVEPSGFRIETLMPVLGFGLIVTPEIRMLMRFPAVPANVRLAFSPPVVVVT